MKQLALVFLGGGLGSVLRYGFGKYLNALTVTFPLGTITVNILGSLLIGLLIGIIVKTDTLSQNILLFLSVGICGGFTTFSAFAYENYEFLKNGELFNFALFSFGSLILGIIAVFIGLWLARLI
jgi:CrcB protein